MSDLRIIKIVLKFVVKQILNCDSSYTMIHETVVIVIEICDNYYLNNFLFGLFFTLQVFVFSHNVQARQPI